MSTALKQLGFGVAIMVATFSVMALTPEEAALIAGAAEQGSAASQLLLGIAFLHGDGGLPRDGRKAAHWLEQAALQDNVYAQEMLAECYENGDGVETSLPLAADWRMKAARRGNVQSQLRLGRMYLTGHGVPKDERQALEWIERAAEEGNAEAQYQLGTLYHAGTGVAADPMRARSLLEKAALQGYEAAIGVLHAIEGLGYRIEDDLHRRPPDLHKLAEDGDAEAQYRLARRCELGLDGEAKDTARAMHWYREAAARGHEGAARALVRLPEVRQ